MDSVRKLRFLGQTAIAGVGMTPYTKCSGQSVLDLAVNACRAAAEDAGQDLGNIDGILSYSWNNDSVPAQAVVTVLRIPEARLMADLNLGGQAPSYLVMLAAACIHAGLASNVLIYRALNGRSGPRVGSVRVPGPAADLRYQVGLSAYPQVIALWARRYLIETGNTADDLSVVPIAQRKWAVDNVRAIRRSPLSLTDYLESPMIADPFRAADCTTEVDGACALLVTSLSEARDLRHLPVVIRGAAYVAGRGAGLDAGDSLWWPDLSRNYTSVLAADLWRGAGMQPADVDMAQLYDCFSSSVLFALEGLGLAARGEAAAFIRDGHTSPGGILPVNTNGGLLCEGYLHGMNTVAEAVLQLQGRAGSRTVPGAQTCVVTSGALTDGSALVLSKGPREGRAQ